MLKIIDEISVEKKVIIVIFAIWCVFSVSFTVSQVAKVLRVFPIFFSMNDDEKHFFVDGNFYNFMKFCEVKIPEKAAITFVIVPKEIEIDGQGWGSREWIMQEYFIGKSAYYLYPRAVFRKKDASVENKYYIVYNLETQALNLIIGE